MGRGDRLLIALAGAAALGSVAASLASDVAGVARHPGYSPVADLIGELHARGAPAAPVVGTLQVLAHLLYLPVAVGLHRSLRTAGGGRACRTLAPLALAAAAPIFLSVTTVARCDPGCLPPRTGPGVSHFLLTGLGWSSYLLAVAALRRAMPAGGASPATPGSRSASPRSGPPPSSSPWAGDGWGWPSASSPTPRSNGWRSSASCSWGAPPAPAPPLRRVVPEPPAPPAPIRPAVRCHP